MPFQVFLRVFLIFRYLVWPVFSIKMGRGGASHIISNPEVGELGKQGAMPMHASLFNLRSWVCIFLVWGLFPQMMQP